MTIAKPRHGGDNTSQHTALVSQIRLALGLEPDLVLWLNRVSHVESYDSVRGGASHSEAGLPRGSSDLIGILTLPIRAHGEVAPFALFMALEVKTGRGVPTIEQGNFLALVRARGGFGGVVRSVDDARQALERARRGELR